MNQELNRQQRAAAAYEAVGQLIHNAQSIPELKRLRIVEQFLVDYYIMPKPKKSWKDAWGLFDARIRNNRDEGKLP
jgi:hypothetical protein